MKGNHGPNSTGPTTDLLTAVDQHVPALLEDLKALVECESPSNDRAAMERCATLLAECALEHGLTVSRLEDSDAKPVPLIGGQAPRVLLLGHLDTVHPVGTLAECPFRLEQGRAYGPGVLDMKAGLVQALYALGLAGVQDAALLVTSDEEIGSPTGRAVIERYAAGAQAVLVLEASRAGALKIARKGVSNYLLTFHGRASHAGLDPQAGANTTMACARAVLAAAQLADPAAGTTVTPTMASSGSSANTVPDLARLAIDVRARDVEEQRRVDVALRAVGELEPGVRMEVSGGPNRPPLPESISRDLFVLARSACTRLGLRPPEGVSVGGGSDGNLTAALGVPTLDGLGAVGDGPHTRDEYVDVDQIAPRTALVAALLQDLTNRPQGDVR